MLTDVLVLGIARTRSGWSIAGMTTEPDALTVLRWVRPIKPEGALTRDDLLYADGSLIQLGDVIRLDLRQPQSQPPHVENVLADWSGDPPQRIRSLSAERRRSFFSRHLDPDPADVLVRRQRSLCLLRPENVEAIFYRDPETARFAARLVFTVGRLHNQDGIPVADPFWRAWGNQHLEAEEYLDLDHQALQTTLGDIYLTVGLGPLGGPMVIGVHAVPAYHIDPNSVRV